MSQSTTGLPPKKKRRKTVWQHPNGQWCKKVGGKFFYFGSVADDPEGDAAERKWLDAKPDLLSGIARPTSGADLTLLELCDRCLVAKRQLVDAGKRSPATLIGYETTIKRLLAFFGYKKDEDGKWQGRRLVKSLTPDDFELLQADAAQTLGIVAIDNLVTYTRCIFNWAIERGMIDWQVRYGDFKIANKKDRRLDADRRGAKTFQPGEIKRLIGAADVQMKAMVMLGINAGFGPSDLANLRLDQLREDGWLETLRPKTGTCRRCWLWKETRAAIQQWREVRPDVQGEASRLVFVRKTGLSWRGNGTFTPIANEFAKLAKKVGVKRTAEQHCGFYGLRHSHRVASDASKDQPAADYVMGHVSQAMSGHYRKPTDISDERLLAISQAVYDWLYGKEPAKKKQPVKRAKGERQRHQLRVVG